MAASTIETTGRSTESRSSDQALEALRDGALTLSREGNQVASLAVLWAAVGIAPDDLGLHRWLAARLANIGNREAAGAEYARYVDVMLERGDIARAELELRYGRDTLGDAPALRSATLRLAAARALESSLPTAAGSVPASPWLFARAVRGRRGVIERVRAFRHDVVAFGARLVGLFGPPRPH